MVKNKFEPARSRGRLNQACVVQAAVKLFNDQGYDRTSMNEIASALGITKAALYYHFASKEDILLYGITQASEHMAAALLGVEASGDCAQQRVASFITAYCKVLIDPTFRCLINADERLLGAEGQSKIRECKRHNQQFLEHLLIDAGAETLDVRAIALTVFGALNWSASTFGERAGAELAGVSGVILEWLSSTLYD